MNILFKVKFREINYYFTFFFVKSISRCRNPSVNWSSNEGSIETMSVAISGKYLLRKKNYTLENFFFEYIFFCFRNDRWSAPIGIKSTSSDANNAKP